jgi:hypothetical protein
MKGIAGIPSNIPAIILFFLFLFSTWCTAYSSSDPPNTYVARTTLVNVQSQMTLSLLSTLQIEDTTSHILADSSTSSAKLLKKPKHPLKAMAFAVIPGVVLHGSGHFYAERRKTAVILLGCEVVGLAMGVFGGLAQSEGAGGSSGSTIEIGALLFFGSWLYDFIAAPLKVYMQNQPQPEEKDIGMGIRFKDKEPKLTLVW